MTHFLVASSHSTDDAFCALTANLETSFEDIEHQNVSKQVTAASLPSGTNLRFSNCSARNKPQMYHSHNLLFVSALTSLVTNPLAVPTLPGVTHYASLPQSNSTTTSSVATAPPHNTTHSPLTFLGVDCYHLLPDTVNLISCQPLFAKMLQEGNPYEQHNWWNGWQFRTGRRGPCTITLSSAAPDDHRRMIRVSIADVMTYATEVLQSCQESRTGGANTFEGSWKVEVTKYPLDRAAFQ